MSNYGHPLDDKALAWWTRRLENMLEGRHVALGQPIKKVHNSNPRRVVSVGEATARSSPVVTERGTNLQTW